MTPMVMAECQDRLKKCDAAVTACDEALEARKKEIQLCNIALLQAKHYSETLNIQVKEKEAELNAWYRNPFVMVTLGIIAGAVINSAVNK